MTLESSSVLPTKLMLAMIVLLPSTSLPLISTDLGDVDVRHSPRQRLDRDGGLSPVRHQAVLTLVRDGHSVSSPISWCLVPSHSWAVVCCYAISSMFKTPGLHKLPRTPSDCTILIPKFCYARVQILSKRDSLGSR